MWKSGERFLILNTVIRKVTETGYRVACRGMGSAKALRPGSPGGLKKATVTE